MDLRDMFEDLEKAKHLKDATFQKIAVGVTAEVIFRIVFLRVSFRDRNDNCDNGGHRGQNINPTPPIAEVVGHTSVTEQEGHHDFQKKYRRHEDLQSKVQRRQVHQKLISPTTPAANTMVHREQILTPESHIKIAAKLGRLR